MVAHLNAGSCHMLHQDSMWKKVGNEMVLRKEGHIHKSVTPGEKYYVCAPPPLPWPL